MPACFFLRSVCCCIPFRFFCLFPSGFQISPLSHAIRSNTDWLSKVAARLPTVYNNSYPELRYSMPFTLKLKHRSPIMMWSNKSTAIKSAHSFSRSVTCMSAFDGRQSPDG